MRNREPVTLDEHIELLNSFISNNEADEFEKQLNETCNVYLPKYNALVKEKVTPEAFLTRFNAEGVTLLNKAVLSGSVRLVRLLLDAGAQVDFFDTHFQLPLALGVRNKNYHIVKELLAEGAQVDIADNTGVTPIKLSEQLCVESADENVHKIAAALRTVMKWQSATQDGFNFIKVLNMIQKGILPVIDSASGHNKVFVIGPSGAGKSTLLNYLNGAKYKIDDSRKIKNPVAKLCGGVEVLKSSGAMKSCTLYPQIVKKPGLNFVYTDLAGLFENRGPDYQVVGAAGLQILSKTAGDIHGLMVVVSFNDLHAERGKVFKKTAKIVANMIRGNNELLKSLFFVITKIEASYDFSVDNFIQDTVLPIINDLEKKKQLKTCLTTKDEALLFMLGKMVTMKDRVLVPRIDDNGTSRFVIEQALMGLRPKKASAFDFTKQDNSLYCFNYLMLNIAQDCLLWHQRYNKILPENMQKENELIEAETDLIESLQAKIQSHEIKLKEPFDKENVKKDLNLLVQERESQLKELERLILAIKDVEIELEKWQKEKDSLDTNNMREVDKVDLDFPNKPPVHNVERISPFPLRRIRSNYSGWGTSSYALLKPQQVGESTFDQTENVFKAYYNFDEDAKNGLYNARFGFTLGLHTINVKFSTYDRDFHARRIRELEFAISDLQQRKQQLTESKSRVVQQNQRREEAIAQRERAHVIAEEQYRHWQELLKKEIEISRADIKSAESRRTESVKRLETNDTEYHKLKWDINVNQEFFEIVYKITGVLDFSAQNDEQNEVVNRFRSRWIKHHPYGVDISDQLDRRILEIKRQLYRNNNHNLDDMSSALISANQVLFKRKIITQEDNYGYSAFNVSREDAHQLLTTNINNILDLLQPVIDEALNHNTEFNEYCSGNNNGDHLRAYLEFDVLQKRIEDGWSHPAVLLALARILNINLRLYKANGHGEIELHHRFRLDHYSNEGENLSFLVTDDNQLESVMPLNLTPYHFALPQHQHIHDSEKLSLVHELAAYGLRTCLASMNLSGCSLLALSARGNTVLHYAVDNQHESLARWLIEEQISVNTRNALGQTPLHLAVIRGHLSMVKLLVTNQADLTLIDNAGKKPVEYVTQDDEVAAWLYQQEIFKVIAENNLPRFRQLLSEHHVDMKIKDSRGYGLFFAAITSNAREIVDFIMGQLTHDYCNLMLEEDSYGNNALHITAACGHYDLFQLISSKDLIERNTNNQLNQNYLHIAIWHKQTEFAKKLISGLNKDVDSLQRLLNEKAMICINNECIRVTPVQLMAIFGNTELFELACKAKRPFFNIRDVHDSLGSLIHIAVQCHQFSFLEKILSMRHYKQDGVKEIDLSKLLELKDVNGYTPLHLAVKLGYIQMVMFLHDKGALLETYENEHGFTPVHTAVMSRHIELIFVLHQLGGVELINCAQNQSPHATPVSLALKNKTDCNNDPLCTTICNILKNIIRNPLNCTQQLESLKLKYYENFVFGGASVRGIGYLGALKEFHNRVHSLEHVKRVAGTSSGSIVALSLALGLSLDDMEARMKKSFIDFLDGKEIPHSKLTLIANLLRDIYFNNHISDGKKLLEWIEELIIFRLQQDNVTLKSSDGKVVYDQKLMTFGDLRKLVEEKRPGYKHLHVICTTINDLSDKTGAHCKKVFSSEDPDCDQIVIADAVKASCTLPYIFPPHAAFKRATNENKKFNTHIYFVDGALAQNFAIDIFNDKKYYPANYSQRLCEINPRTLGFRIVSEGSLQPHLNKPQNTWTLHDELARIATLVLNKDLIDFNKAYERQTISISDTGIGFNRFNMTANEKLGLLQSGRTAVYTFFNLNYLYKPTNELAQAPVETQSTTLIQWIKATPQKLKSWWYSSPEKEEEADEKAADENPGGGISYAQMAARLEEDDIIDAGSDSEVAPKPRKELYQGRRTPPLLDDDLASSEKRGRIDSEPAEVVAAAVIEEDLPEGETINKRAKIG